MLSPAFRRVAAISSFALATSACVNWTAIHQAGDDRYARAMASATDPDARAYLTGSHECEKDFNNFADATLEKIRVCAVANEDRTLASLKKQEEEAAPNAREAVRNASTCILAIRPLTNSANKRGARDEAAVTRCLEERASAIRTKTSEDDAYAAAEKDGSPDAWLAFIAKHQDHPRVPIAVKHLLQAAAGADGDAQAAIDEKLVAAYPKARSELPAARRVALVGPKGLRVRDIAKLSAANVSPSIVVARVKASTESYKSFDADELGALKQLGIADDVVTAMIEVTSKLEDRKKADDERQAMRSELAALRAIIEEKKASGGAQSGEIVQTKEGPMDVLASCAKRLGAMKLCDQIPFPGSTICASTAESSFPCPTK